MLTRVECVEVNNLVIELRERRVKKNSYIYSSLLSSEDYREWLRYGKRNGKRRHSKPDGYKRETRVEIVLLERQRRKHLPSLSELSEFFGIGRKGFTLDEMPTLLDVYQDV